VAVINPTTGRQVGSTLTLTGDLSSPPTLSADGSRAFVTYGNGQAVIDTATGKAVPDSTATPEQSVVSPASDSGGSTALSPDGTRAVSTTEFTDPSTNAKTTQVTVTDTATDNQVGSTVTLAGEMWPPTVLFGADGTHAIISTSAYDPRNGTPTMLVSTIDTTTGLRVGTTLALTGFMLASPVFNADRSHLVFTSSGRDGATGTDVTQLGVVDTNTGIQVGSTLSFSDNGSSYSPVFSADGGRVLIQTDASDPPARFATRLAVVDTTTGTQIGSTLTFRGTGAGTVLSDDNGHALVVTITPHLLSLTMTTRVTLLRIA
jgi:hypothetical protein